MATMKAYKAIGESKQRKMITACKKAGGLAEPSKTFR